jgi:hypothetical protein
VRLGFHCSRDGFDRVDAIRCFHPCAS